MNRPQRIRLVVAAALGLFWLLVGLLAAPTVASVFLPSADEANTPQQLSESLTAWMRLMQISGYVSLVALVFAGICFCYVMYVLVGWFIGPKEDQTPNASERPTVVE